LKTYGKSFIAPIILHFIYRPIFSGHCHANVVPLDLFSYPVQRTRNGNLRDAKWFYALYATEFCRKNLFSASIRIMEIDIKNHLGT